MPAKTYSAVISKPEDALCTVRAVKSNHLHYSCCQAEMRGVREVSPAPASHHSPGLSAAERERLCDQRPEQMWLITPGVFCHDFINETSEILFKH